MSQGAPVSRLGLALLVAGVATAAEAQAPSSDRFAPRWNVRIGHAYSSPQALRQPATFVFVAESDRPTLTELDVGGLAGGPLGDRGGVEVGGRLSAGSARARAKRVFGFVARLWQHRDPVVVALGGEYEADGGFDVQKGVASLEVTVTGGAPGLGAPIGPAFPLRWRPWVGVGYGNVFTTRAGVRQIEERDFVRAHLRLEVGLMTGKSEFGLEATSWLVEGRSPGTSYLKGALAVPLVGGLSLAASGEVGRQPPRFLYTRRMGFGLGFRR